MVPVKAIPFCFFLVLFAVFSVEFVIARSKIHHHQKTTFSSFQEAVDAVWEADLENRVDPASIQLNWGGKLHRGEIRDVSDKLLYAHVDESILERPIYAAFVQLLREGVFHRPVCQAEPEMSGERKAKIQAFMDLVFESKAFRVVHQYLSSIQKAEPNFDQFCERVFALWFGVYSRCCSHTSENDLPDSPWVSEEVLSSEEEKTCVMGSSGWEHIHFGEYNEKGGKKHEKIVEGHHNWLNYYLQEKAGEINYHGYFAYNEGLIGTIQYTWNGYLKEIGGGFMTTSPAFDFSISTLCILAHPGEEACKFRLEGNGAMASTANVSMTSFKEPCGRRLEGNVTPKECLSTCYPGIKF